MRTFSMKVAVNSLTLALTCNKRSKVRYFSPKIQLLNMVGCIWAMFSMNASINLPVYPEWKHTLQRVSLMIQTLLFEGLILSICTRKWMNYLQQVSLSRWFQSIRLWLSSHTCLYSQVRFNVQILSKGTTLRFYLQPSTMSVFSYFSYSRTQALVLVPIPPHQSLWKLPPKHQDSMLELGKTLTLESSNLTQLAYFLVMAQQWPTSGPPECTMTPLSFNLQQSLSFQCRRSYSNFFLCYQSYFRPFIYQTPRDYLNYRPYLV